MGRIAKWGMMLSAFDIKYMPRTVIKGQVLADLVAEFTEELVEGEMLGSKIMVVSIPCFPAWEVYTNGAANQKGFGVGIVLISTEKITVEKSLRLGFPATNNEVEYKALLAGMVMVSKMGGKVVEVFSNSRLVVGKLMKNLRPGTNECKDISIKLDKLNPTLKFFT